MPASHGGPSQPDYLDGYLEFPEGFYYVQDGLGGFLFPCGMKLPSFRIPFQIPLVSLRRGTSDDSVIELGQFSIAAPIWGNVWQRFALRYNRGDGARPDGRVHTVSSGNNTWAGLNLQISNGQGSGQTGTVIYVKRVEARLRGVNHPLGHITYTDVTDKVTAWGGIDFDESYHFDPNTPSAFPVRDIGQGLSLGFPKLKRVGNTVSYSMTDMNIDGWQHINNDLIEPWYGLFCTNWSEIHNAVSGTVPALVTQNEVVSNYFTNIPAYTFRANLSQSLAYGGVPTNQRLGYMYASTRSDVGGVGEQPNPFGGPYDGSEGGAYGMVAQAGMGLKWTNQTEQYMARFVNWTLNGTGEIYAPQLNAPVRFDGYGILRGKLIIGSTTYTSSYSADDIPRANPPLWYGNIYPTLEEQTVTITRDAGGSTNLPSTGTVTFVYRENDEINKVNLAFIVTAYNPFWSNQEMREAGYIKPQGNYKVWSGNTLLLNSNSGFVLQPGNPVDDRLYVITDTVVIDYSDVTTSGEVINPQNGYDFPYGDGTSITTLLMGFYYRNPLSGNSWTGQTWSLDYHNVDENNNMVHRFGYSYITEKLFPDTTVVKPWHAETHWDMEVEYTFDPDDRIKSIDGITITAGQIGAAYVTNTNYVSNPTFRMPDENGGEFEIEVNMPTPGTSTGANRPCKVKVVTWPGFQRFDVDQVPQLT
jgi:hypothetical protein